MYQMNNLSWVFIVTVTFTFTVTFTVTVVTVAAVVVAAVVVAVVVVLRYHRSHDKILRWTNNLFKKDYINIKIRFTHTQILCMYIAIHLIENHYLFFPKKMVCLQYILQYRIDFW